MDMVKEAKHFGVEVSSGNFDWATLKEARDSYITRLNGIYERNLANSGVEIIEGVSKRIQRLCCRQYNNMIDKNGETRSPPLN